MEQNCKDFAAAKSAAGRLMCESHVSKGGSCKRNTEWLIEARSYRTIDPRKGFYFKCNGKLLEGMEYRVTCNFK